LSIAILYKSGNLFSCKIPYFDKTIEIIPEIGYYIVEGGVTMAGISETSRRIQMLREAKGITKKKAAEDLEMSYTTYCHYEDGSIEVEPQAQGVPIQKDVKKVGKSKRYVTSGKSPLTCVELKCPEDVPDKAAYFRKELEKLTKDIEIEKPQMPDGEFLMNEPNVKVCLNKGEQKVVAWLTFDAKGLLDVRRELYNLTSKIDKCFVINEASVCQLK
jgi:transcriptional regulator with XRE-family HTH domain